MAETRKQTRGIAIDDKYGIVVMPIDYALAKIKKDKNGDMYFTPFKFCGSIEKCLEAYLRETVHDEISIDTVITLDEAIERIATASKRVALTIKHACPPYRVYKV